MDINSKSEFIYFMQRACEDQSNDCYIELYNILLRFCFIKKSPKKMFPFLSKKLPLSASAEKFVYTCPSKSASAETKALRRML